MIIDWQDQYFFYVRKQTKRKKNEMQIKNHQRFQIQNYYLQYLINSSDVVGNCRRFDETIVKSLNISSKRSQRILLFEFEFIC